MSKSIETRYRPLQIVHDFRKIITPTGDAHTGLMALKAQGIGGVVTNMPFDNYMQGEETWQAFGEFLRTCKATGMRVWIYDEKGYPSGWAGGLVLANRPDLEAQGLYRDPDTGEIAPGISYEGTHNVNNWAMSARTINLLEASAAEEFIRVTHERYLRELGSDLSIAEAFFTDEPALNVVYMPEIPAAKNRPIIDPPDENRPLYPGVPWSNGLAKRFAKRDLTGLFVDQPDSESLRREYYKEVGEELENSFFGSLERWCGSHGMQSSGHLLWEEIIAGHTALYGNFLRCLMRLDIPGIDILSAEPVGSCKGSRVAAIFAASAAMLSGTRRIFSESSDHSQRTAEGRIATVDEVRASLAWQAALGVTDFTFYFSPGVCPELNGSSTPELSRTPAEYLQINDDIGGLVERLSPASLKADVFLYYPVELMNAAYYPTLRPWDPDGKAPKLVKIASAFLAAVNDLLDAGIIPCLIDGGMLAELRQTACGYAVRKANAKAVVYPAGCPPPADCAPGCDCDLFEMSPTLPQRLFEQGAARLLNDNHDVCVGVMEMGSQSLATLVNLTGREQTCRLRTASGSVEVKVEGYRSVTSTTMCTSCVVAETGGRL